LQITAGAGGTESCRNYGVYHVGEKYGYKIKELNYQEGCWYKTVTLEFEETILWLS
jgi:peptide chain release factor 2